MDLRDVRPYHHGNLREEAVAAAVVAVAESGAAALSARDVARRLGVSHSAVAHHFGDKTGLLTAVALQGFLALTDRLEVAWDASGSFAEVGIAYVAFAVEEPALFEVMFRPELYRADDPELARARGRAGEVLSTSAAQVADAADGDTARAGLAGWAYAHGIATLWKDGLLAGPEGDPVDVARVLIPYLFQASSQRPATPPRSDG